MGAFEFEYRGDLIGGRWSKPLSPEGEIVRESPADLSDRVGVFPFAAAQVDAAVEAARAAAEGWRQTPLEERIRLVKRLGEALDARAERLVALLGREVGKPDWEARMEAAALAAKVEITVAEGLRWVEDFSLDGGRLACRFRPHGVLAVLGPFNFPLHLPHGHIVPALLTGNAVVFKPSELAPACGQLYAEAALEAGLPPGVFNLVQGPGAVGARLSAHEGIDGVLFTGSYEAGVAISKANVERPGRLLALELGGKNAGLVLADAPFEKSVYDVLFSAFVTAGQRCTALGRLIVERPIAERFIEALIEKASGFRVGHPAAADTFMGPLVSEAALARFESVLSQAAGEAEVLLPSKRVEVGHVGHYVSPSLHLITASDRQSEYQRRELFGPDLAIQVAEDEEEAWALANDSEYGLAAAIYTQSEARFERLAARLEVGVAAWNAPSVGSSSRLPFGGLRRSGNHRPAALFSPLYCVWPQAQTRGSPSLDLSALPPGVVW